ncbi:MAG: hypothetical protein HY706_12155 [Candidatus Hydrogenedentes bacterium]|nr:hypothetical protein [Candidatus Hydrogenedentota bacterium]
MQSAWITRESAAAKNVVLVARALWHNREDVRIQVTVSANGPDGAAKKVTREFRAQAPAAGGGPEGWRRFQSVALHETAGLDRNNEPVECSITVRSEDCHDLGRELRVFAYEPTGGGLSAAPFQTFNAQSYPGRPTGTSNENYLQHPSMSLDVVFLASVPARGARVYIIAYDNPTAEILAPLSSDLRVTGPELGATVENESYRVQLDKKSGQIAAIELKGRHEKPVPPLTNSYSFAMHWNPDSFADNAQWGHTFAWNPPDHTYVTANGPILFRITNRGRMPDSTPQVQTSVTYSFYAGLPYVKCTTVTEARDPVNASAIRNGEIVLDSHLVTHFVWQEKTGKLKKIRTVHGPNWQDEWATRVDHDVPWIAMTNELDDYGIGTAIENSFAFNPVCGEATTHRPAFYLYYHHFWQIPLTYFTRGWVYPFSDYQRGPILPVKAGSTYVEKMAFVPFYMKDHGKRYQDMMDASTQVEYPLVQRWGR